jgi:ribosomal-protein-alanine N-acetyltransferase
VVLRTHRLMIRQFTIGDAEFILSLLNDPAFLRYIGDKGVRTLEDARNYLTTGPIESYRKYGFGLNLVELKATKTPIGMCGLLKRDALEHVDLGFAFMPDYRRQGYAFESASSVLTHGREVFRLNKILAITDPDNQSSIKLLERLGFQFEGMIRLSEDAAEVKLFANSDKL